MSLVSWFDQGVRFKVFLATTGDALDLGDRTDYPFQSGGVGGLPLGWSTYSIGASDNSSVNLTTQEGRFSVSNKNPPTVLANQKWGTYRSFPVDANFYWLVNLQVRTMQDRDDGSFEVSVEARNANTSTVLNVLRAVSKSDWETLAFIYRGTIDPQYVYIDVAMAAGYTTPPTGVTGKTNWGVQFQNVSIQKIPKTPTLPQWREVTCDVRSVDYRYGRERYTSRYDVASMDIVLQNPDGIYAYQDPHPFNLRPGRWIKGEMFLPAAPTFKYSQFYGMIDSINDSYTVDGKATTTITAFDPTTVLAGMDTPTITTGITSSEQKSTARAAAVMNGVGWLNYQVDTDGWIQQIIVGSGRTVRDELSVGAESEGGVFYAERNGVVTFRSRNYNSTNLNTVYANLLATPFHNVGTLPIIDDVPTDAGAPSICVDTLVTDWARDRIINLVDLANAGGSAFIYEDATSQKKYGVQSYQRHDYLNTNTNGQAYLDQRATDIMGRFHDAMLRVNSVEFSPEIMPLSKWPYLNYLWLNQAVRVWYGNPDGWAYASVTHIQSVIQSVTPQGWKIQLTLDQPLSFTRWHYSTVGWDLGQWDDTAKWDI